MSIKLSVDSQNHLLINDVRPSVSLPEGIATSAFSDFNTWHTATGYAYGVAVNGEHQQHVINTLP